MRDVMRFCEMLRNVAKYCVIMRSIVKCWEYYEMLRIVGNFLGLRERGCGQKKSK